MALLACSAAVFASVLHVEIERIEHPAFVLSGIQVEVGDEEKPAHILIKELAAGEYRWRNLRLSCSKLGLSGGIIDCPDGMLSAPGGFDRTQIAIRFDLNQKRGDVRLQFAEKESVDIAVESDGQVHATLTNLQIDRLTSLLTPVVDLSAWGVGGQLSGQAGYRPDAENAIVTFNGSLADARFSSADGLKAADNLTLGVSAKATASGQNWRWQVDTEWREGEAYFHPLYLKAQAGLIASGSYLNGRMVIDRASLALEGVRAIEGSGEFDLSSMSLARAALMVASADLSVIGPRFIAPVLMPASADSLRFAGLVSAGVEISAEGVTALSLGFDQVGFSVAESQLSFGPLNGVVPWRLDTPGKAHLQVDGGRWQKLALGGFELNARMNGHAVDIDNVEIPILDGSLVLSDLALRHDETGWEGSGAAAVKPISVKLLTEAVGLPAMSGILSASLPGLHIRPGVLSLDGVLAISVFGGLVQITNLQAIEPFGVASHLYADVEATHIDLLQLSETFSFGSVTGFVDASIHGLELARWRPVQFDAQIGSSSGKYDKRISQRAVQNISALGGAGAVAAIQRGVLSFFDSFGYRRIGLSCKLANGVCLLDGLKGADSLKGKDQFMIIEGGGIPALNVIGYNRRMDWNELLDRLQRITEANSTPVIQ